MAQMVERCVRDAEVACSNHVTPIEKSVPKKGAHFSFFNRDILDRRIVLNERFI